MNNTQQASAGFPGQAKAGDDSDATASLWVVRQRRGLDEREQGEFSRWLESSPAHAESFSRMSAMAGVLHRIRAQGAGGTILSQLAVRGRQRRGRRVVVAATVAMVMLTFAGVWWNRLNPALTRTKATVAMQSPEPIRRLPDSSIVELNGQAEIAVMFDTTVRQVNLLRGEALFRVEKDPARPFVVRAGGVEVRAVGTAFNVRLHSAGVEVLVTEGKVGVAEAGQRKSLLPPGPSGEDRLLIAGEKLVVAPTTKTNSSPSVELTEVSAADIRARLAWRVPRLEFDGEVLAQAVEQMNRQNRIQIRIGEGEIAQWRISGTFLTDDPQTFARLVAATFGIEAKQRGDSEIVLQRAK
jgi:transmembrane sensor